MSTEETSQAPVHQVDGRFRNAVPMKIGEWECRLIDEYAQQCACGGEYVFYDLDAVNYKAGICHKCGRETCMDTNFFVVCHDTARANRFTRPAPIPEVCGPASLSPTGEQEPAAGSVSTAVVGPVLGAK